MLKTTYHKDELLDQATKGAASLDKMDKLTKKEFLEKEKPIDPKFIFNDYKKSAVDKGKSYRKPKPETDGGKKKIKVVSLNDY